MTAHYKLLLKTEPLSAVGGNEDSRTGYTWERLDGDDPFYNRSFYAEPGSPNKVLYTLWGDKKQTTMGERFLPSLLMLHCYFCFLKLLHYFRKHDIAIVDAETLLTGAYLFQISLERLLWTIIPQHLLR